MIRSQFRRLLVSVTVLLVLAPTASRADDAHAVSSFLQACAWGTAIGAGVGTLSLAFEDNPGKHTMNIARGASLGLYGGIFYGAAQVRQNAIRSDYGFVVPRWDLQSGSLDGADWHWLAASF